jgi:hypothetical protein
MSSDQDNNQYEITKRSAPRLRWSLGRRVGVVRRGRARYLGPMPGESGRKSFDLRPVHANRGYASRVVVQ